MSSRPSRPVLPVALLVALLVTVLTAVLTAALPSPAQAVRPLAEGPASPGADPAEDYPALPQECTPRREKIPVQPVVCDLNGFDEARPTVLLWGDSHAWMFLPALQAAAEGREVNLLAVLMGSCPPMDNAVTSGAEVAPCFRSNALGVRTVRRLAAGDQPYRVVLAGSWERYVLARDAGDRRTYIGKMAEAMRDGLPRLVKRLDTLGADVDVVAQVATVPERRGACAVGEAPYACAVPRARALPEEALTSTYVATTFGRVLGTRAPIDVTPTLCTERICQGTVGSTLTWFDDLHLSASMASTLSPYFAPTVDAVAPPPPLQEPTCTIPIICP